jgi:hypothetical protein
VDKQSSPQAVLIEGYTLPGPATISESRFAFWSDVVFKVIILGAVIGLIVAVVIQGSKIRSQNTQLAKLKANSTAQQMQLAEILMDMGQALNETLRNNGTYYITGFNDNVALCTTPTGSAQYSVYDVTISDMLPFVVVLLYPPSSPLLFDDASCGGVTIQLSITSWNFTPPVPEILEWFDSGTSFQIFSTYNRAVVPPCSTCTYTPTYFYPQYYVWDVPTNDGVSVAYANYPSGDPLPIIWTYNASTPLRLVLPLS